MIDIQHIDCGRMEYNAAWELQRELFDSVQCGERQGMLMIVEHDHVYTLGRSGQLSNMLISDRLLAEIGATLVRVDRGGDITYHGPGQIVGYPILNLTLMGISLRDYIFKLEQVIIDTLAEFGIVGERLSGATGVWVDRRRKIAAIGVRASRSVTMHGFALNVCPDLSYFSHINPCGFTDKATTSINNEIEESKTFSMTEVSATLCDKFKQQFGVELLPTKKR